VDLPGTTLMPGLIETHDHLPTSGTDVEYPDYGPHEVARLTLNHADAAAALAPASFAAVYLDPMYPERRKSAKVKKHMQALQQLIGHHGDDATLLARARLAATRRVIVKRPQHAPPLADIAPHHAIDGPNTRYDIYLAPNTPDKN